MRDHDRAIARLAIPAFGALVAEPLYVLADTAIVGRIGTPQLAGLAVASTVLLTLHAVFIFLAYGTTAAVARRMGAGERREAAHQAIQSLWLAVSLGVVMTLLGLAFGEPLLRALGAEGEVLTNGLVYLRISLLGLPAMFVTLAGTGWLRGVQDTRTPLYVAGGTALFNLVLQSILVFGFDQGIGASALSTVVSQMIGALVYLRVIRRGVVAAGAAIRPHLASIRRLLIIGWDLLVRTAALRAALIIATAVAARIGVTDLAAHQVAFEVWNFLALTLDAIAIAGQALVGTYLGAGDAAEARRVGDRMLQWGVVGGALVGVVLLLLRSPVAQIFSEDGDVVALAGFLLIYVAVLQPVNGVVFVLDGLLIGAGDMRFLAKAMLGALAAFTPVALSVLWLDLGIGWLWVAFGVLMVARLVALLARWRAGAWAVVGATA